MMEVKKLQLIQGDFDEKDLKKLANVYPEFKPPEELTIDDGIELYFETTASRRKPRVQREDKRAALRLFAMLQAQGKIKFTDILPLDVQQLFQQLHLEGKSEATLKTYHRIMSKVFRWLIDDVEMVEMKNPLLKVQLPNKGKQVRDRIPSVDEVFRLLRVLNTPSMDAHRNTVQQLVKFILFTGARKGEALHAEFNDFDWELGIWNVRHKPHCPTRSGLGWTPKWGKERTVSLFPEVLEILQVRPNAVNYGKVPV